MGGYGLCLVPELVICSLNFPVDVYPLDVDEKRTIVLASLHAAVQAPAVQKMRDYIVTRLRAQKDTEHPDKVRSTDH